MAQRPQAHPDVRQAPSTVSRHERMAQLRVQGEALGDEFQRLEEEEDAERAAAEVDAEGGDGEEAQEADQQPTAESEAAGDAATDASESATVAEDPAAGESDPPAQPADPAPSAGEGTAAEPG